MSEQKNTKNEDVNHTEDQASSTKKEQLVDSVLSSLVESSVTQICNDVSVANSLNSFLSQSTVRHLNLPNSSKRSLSNIKSIFDKEHPSSINELFNEFLNVPFNGTEINLSTINEQKNNSEEVKFHDTASKSETAPISILEDTSQHIIKSSIHLVPPNTPNFSLDDNTLKNEPKQVIVEDNYVRNRFDNSKLEEASTSAINKKQSNSYPSLNHRSVSRTLSYGDSITYLLPQTSSYTNLPFSLTKRTNEKEKNWEFIDNFNNRGNTIGSDDYLQEIECISITATEQDLSLDSNEEHTCANVRKIDISIAGSSKEDVDTTKAAFELHKENINATSSLSTTLDANENSAFPDLWSTFNMERTTGLPDIFPHVDRQISSSLLTSTVINTESLEHITDNPNSGASKAHTHGLLPEVVPQMEETEMSYNRPSVNIENVGVHGVQEPDKQGSSKECVNTTMTPFELNNENINATSSLNKTLEPNETTSSAFPDLWSTFNMERTTGLPDIFPRVDRQISSCLLRSTLINTQPLGHVTESPNAGSRRARTYGLLPEDVPQTEGAEMPYLPSVNVENVGVHRVQEPNTPNINVISANTQMYHEVSPNLTEIIALPQNITFEEPSSVIRQRRELGTVSNIYEFERTTAMYSSPNFRTTQDGDEVNVQQERFRPFYSMDEIVRNAHVTRK